jgi:tRNA dimethylallyltransferase
MANKKTLIVVVGPTAVGKTAVAIELAKKYNCEILSADSRQFYQEMSIGTAKPTTQEMNGVPHHFINNLSIHQGYSAGMFEREALSKLDELYTNHDVAILVGGSGLFIDAVCHGLDDIPKATDETRQKLNLELESKGLEHIQNRVKEIDPIYFESVDIKNYRRLIRALEVFETSGKTLTSFQNLPKPVRPFNCVWIGLDMAREKLYDRINLRVDLMMNDGLLEEVNSLKEFKDLNPLKTVGYQEFYEAEDVDTALELVKRNSRRYAKRQLTWFRRNKDTKWFKPNEVVQVIKHIEVGS